MSGAFVWLLLVTKSPAGGEPTVSVYATQTGCSRQAEIVNHAVTDPTKGTYVCVRQAVPP
jgi:hypothetical protein